MGATSKEALPFFSKAIRDVSHRHDLSRVFDDFLQMSVCCFAFGRMEDQYLTIANKYDQGELKRFSLALAAMINEYEVKSQDGKWWDVLGHFFEEINSPSGAQRSGQFFTPKSICDMMAQMVKHEDYTRDITISDPSCGSGRNLIAEARLNSQNRFNRFYVAQDLDRRCVNMTVLNYIMYGMKGIVIHMNTLTMEIFSGFRVYLPETGLGVIPLNESQCRMLLLEQKEVNQEPHPPVENKSIGSFASDIEPKLDSGIDSFDFNF